MEQINQHIQNAQVDETGLDDALEDFDIDEILENEIKTVLHEVTKTKILYQSIQNSRRYFNGR